MNRSYKKPYGWIKPTSHENFKTNCWSILHYKIKTYFWESLRRIQNGFLVIYSILAQNTRLVRIRQSFGRYKHNLDTLYTFIQTFRKHFYLMLRGSQNGYFPAKPEIDFLYNHYTLYIKEFKWSFALKEGEKELKRKPSFEQVKQFTVLFPQEILPPLSGI